MDTSWLQCKKRCCQYEPQHSLGHKFPTVTERVVTEPGPYPTVIQFLCPKLNRERHSLKLKSLCRTIVATVDVLCRSVHLACQKALLCIDCPVGCRTAINCPARKVLAETMCGVCSGTGKRTIFYLLYIAFFTENSPNTIQT